MTGIRGVSGLNFEPSDLMDLPSIVIPKCFHSCGIPTASAIQRSAFHAATCNSRWVGRYSGLRPSVYRPTESNRRLAALLSEPSFSPMSYRLKDTQYCVSAILQRRHLLQLCPGFPTLDTTLLYPERIAIPGARLSTYRTTRSSSANLPLLGLTQVRERPKE